MDLQKFSLLVVKSDGKIFKNKEPAENDQIKMKTEMKIKINN